VALQVCGEIWRKRLDEQEVQFVAASWQVLQFELQATHVREAVTRPYPDGQSESQVKVSGLRNVPATQEVQCPAVPLQLLQEEEHDWQAPDVI